MKRIFILVLCRHFKPTFLTGFHFEIPNLWRKIALAKNKNDSQLLQGYVISFHIDKLLKNRDLRISLKLKCESNIILCPKKKEDSGFCRLRLKMTFLITNIKIVVKLWRKRLFNNISLSFSLKGRED